MRAIVVRRCTDWGGTVQASNGETDYVFILPRLPPDFDLSRFVIASEDDNLTSAASDYGDPLKTFHLKLVLWCTSYCAVSCTGASLSFIKRYFEQQKTPD